MSSDHGQATFAAVVSSLYLGIYHSCLLLTSSPAAEAGSRTVALAEESEGAESVSNPMMDLLKKSILPQYQHGL